MSTNERNEARDKGRQRKDRGMERGAYGNHRAIVETQIAFLEALITSSTGRATSDDAAGEHLARKFSDGGKWRGTVFRELAEDGLIRRDGFTPSDRTSRHGAHISVWAAVDRQKIDRRLDALKKWVADHPLSDPMTDDAPSIPPVNEPGAAAATETPGDTNDTHIEGSDQ